MGMKNPYKRTNPGSFAPRLRSLKIQSPCKNTKGNNNQSPFNLTKTPSRRPPTSYQLPIMTVLKRFQVFGKTVSLIETEESIELEVPSDTRKDSIYKYLEDEGILEEILSGNRNFEEALSVDVDPDLYPS